MEHAYLVCYDIGNPRRWRRVFKTMKGFGEWLQLSVFHCRLTREKHLRMQDLLGEMINRSEDHLLIIDLGPADSVELRVESIGRPFDPIEKRPVIV
ncbi:MAG: CRISPR-associated endonuclease Cas2 [Syntrophobacter sp.]